MTLKINQLLFFFQTAVNCNICLGEDCYNRYIDNASKIYFILIQSMRRLYTNITHTFVLKMLGYNAIFVRSMPASAWPVHTVVHLSA